MGYRCAKRVLPHGSCLWLTISWLRSELKRAGGRGCVLPSTRPPAVEGGRAPMEEGPGGGLVSRVIHHGLWHYAQLALAAHDLNCGTGVAPRWPSCSVSRLVLGQMDLAAPSLAATVAWWPGSPARWPAPAPAAFGPLRKCAAPCPLCAPCDPT